jgi:hypothetical protein
MSATLGEPQPTEPQSGASVYAGEQVTRSKHGVGSESLSGTAGLLVRRTGATPGRFVLTCAHVLGPRSTNGALADTDAVYAPHLSVVLWCCECDHPIGDVVPATLPAGPGPGVQAKTPIAGADYAVDAALIALRPKTAATNKVPGIGELTAPRDLIGEWRLPASPPVFDGSRPFQVRKHGAVTGLTSGKMVGLHQEPIVGPHGEALDPAQTGLVLEVEAVPPPGQPVPTATYTLDMERCKANMSEAPATPDGVASVISSRDMALTATVGGPADAPVLTVTGGNFSVSGDSGAPVVDADGKVVGILLGGPARQIYVAGRPEPVDIFGARSRVIFIRAALEFTGTQLLPPGTGASGPRGMAPGTLLERGPLTTADRTALAATRAGFERTRPGAELVALGQRHFAEIRDLVHHNRRVMVAWHRYRGPAFVNAFIAAAARPGWPVPREIAGVRLTDTLRVMRDMLSAYASPSLSAAVAARADDLLAIAERVVSMEDLLREWSSPVLRLVTARGVPGTAAALVRDGAGTAYLLTAHHVAFGHGGAAGDQVFAVRDDPGSGDPGSAEAGGPVPVGTVSRGQIGRFGDGRSFVDAALVELTLAPGHPGWLAEALAALPTTMAAGLHAGAVVTKDGPATGATRGILLDPGYHDHPVIEGCRFSAPAQLLLGPAGSDLVFCAPGDSGAAVLDEHGHCAGLLWGANDSGAGLATPMQILLDALGVQLSGAVPGSGGPA